MNQPAHSRSLEFNRLLRRSGWSQARAARALEITPGAISQICARKTSPRASTVSLLRQALHQPRPAAACQPWERNLLNAVRRLPPPERRALALIVRRMIRGPHNS